jgi:hypothetical protein
MQQLPFDDKNALLEQTDSKKVSNNLVKNAKRDEEWSKTLLQSPRALYNNFQKSIQPRLSMINKN